AAVASEAIARPAGKEYRDRTNGRENRRKERGAAHAVTEEVAQVHGCPGVERLAHHGRGETEQTDHEERTAAQQWQQPRHETLRGLRPCKHVAGIGLRLRVSLIG